MLWLNYFIIISLLLATAAKYFSPQLIWLIAFFGLAFPFIFLANFAFIIYWVIQFRRLLLLSLIAALIAMPTVSKFIQFNSQKVDTTRKPIRITSYNSMLFDLYNWSHNKETRAKIFENLVDLNSDIICFQEFYTSEEKNDFNNIDSLTKLLNLGNYHTEYTTTLREFDHWGMATFSRFPIINRGKIMFRTRTNNLCIYTDILMRKDTVRVYNMHLQSISFSKKDNEFLANLKKDTEFDDDVEMSKNILRRLKRAFLKRTKQVDVIKTHMSTCGYKIILCGDFNDTPASFAYNQLSEKLNDAFLSKGYGFGRTYAGSWPQFRIDYILLDPAFTCNKFQRAEETFTDHFPITAHFY